MNYKDEIRGIAILLILGVLGFAAGAIAGVLTDTPAMIIGVAYAVIVIVIVSRNFT